MSNFKKQRKTKSPHTHGYRGPTTGHCKQGMQLLLKQTESHVSHGAWKPCRLQADPTGAMDNPAGITGNLILQVTSNTVNYL